MKGVATDIGILQLALNLEYLEAQFYSIAVLGRPLPDASLTGSVGTRDAGIAVVDSSGNPTGASNISAADGNGIAYSRSTAQVHNIVYLRRDAGIGGGFFPAGTNNSIEALRTSGATA